MDHTELGHGSLGIAKVLTELGAGMQPETADRWLDAWVLEATGRQLPRDGAYWQAGWEWIAAERVRRAVPPN